MQSILKYIKGYLIR